MNFFDRIQETQITRTPTSSIFPLAAGTSARRRGKPTPLQAAAQRRIARAAVMEVLG
ncbi:hypothetical protein ACX40Y_06820 [Sphingomonas sp. RS6]